MEIKVAVNLGDELWRVVDVLGNSIKDESLRKLLAEEVAMAAGAIANKAFEMGREYEKRNAA